ncbi:hypothetical protein [Cumulibacter manganitolerans]|uniref:hypothetical protein n=1 Tax=Cumulibacter manganitolerans TaxID=1884992 RepID=UPI001294DF47|nr:hypothetical protein [Cumulibacter manganitolerans]
MSTTFATPVRSKTPAKPKPSGAPRRSFTEQRRAARRSRADRSLRAQLVRGRSLVTMAVARREQGSRWPFAIMFAVIAGVSVVALLILNTATAQTSFTERHLNSTLSDLTLAEQKLQQQVAAKQAPGELAKRAGELGMQPGTNPGNLVINPDGSVSWVEPKPAAAAPAPAPAADPENPAAQPAPQAGAPVPNDAAQQPPQQPTPSTPTAPANPGA